MGKQEERQTRDALERCPRLDGIVNALANVGADTKRIQKSAHGHCRDRRILCGGGQCVRQRGDANNDGCRQAALCTRVLGMRHHHCRARVMSRVTVEVRDLIVSFWNTRRHFWDTHRPSCDVRHTSVVSEGGVFGRDQNRVRSIQLRALLIRPQSSPALGYFTASARIHQPFLC
jgi:hypothetical protein